MSQDAHIPIYKMNGLGNQIVVADLRRSSAVLSEDQARTIAAHPRTPFDQLMCLHRPQSPATAAYIRIHNTDGSSAGACGNGMRCVGLITRDGDGQGALKFETSAGILDVAFPGDGMISVDMGRPRFDWQDIPLRDPFHDTTRIELQVGPIDDPLLDSPSVCNMGNPHAVFWVDDVDAPVLEKFGPMLENHPIFPDRANISLAQIVANDHARARTWERGAGLTQACGSAACAVLACGARLGRLARKATISVPGGDLLVEWNAQDRIIMTGPAELEYRGVMHIGADGAVAIEA